ncbi:hypothetical protein KLPPOU148_043 [Klebsiella phage vB_KpnM_15-38_KLPPOU148]|uniref:Uncharacterized protein n=2 Tax=Jameshumphriesvirinae TaxID=3152215 RepID=A0AAE8YSA6_9CAUD|nr:hypothetical protein PQZ55_gp43 [Klebsiella phage vB_KpnM_15-38_KLPPOU148]YP_010684005.1 hypothetical protein PQZ61_gp08 [Klebsiella phage vB_KpnM_JustaPhage]QGZ13430.1 hypothetical protein KLPPOU148_043 [Klebsiella phage vB_KpnM_15-38_KLPPOU148]UGO49345.1 hypothetical protein JUSTAPHAGE_8 [Klebsiella phage vB_KpnM_JustaPhage]
MITERQSEENKTEIIEITVLGTVEYLPGRQFPYMGCHGCICQFFATKSEAVDFARTGR